MTVNAGFSELSPPLKRPNQGETVTKLSIAIGGEFGNDCSDEFLAELREDIEDELRLYWGGSGVTIEIERET